MILSILRPYFAPYPGYLYRMLRSDKVVLLDRIQFPRGSSWITRNRFKNDQGVLWLSVPVWKKTLGLQRIDRVRVCREGRWMSRYPESLERAYANAPYWPEHRPWLRQLFAGKFEFLLDLNLAALDYLTANFGIQTPVLRQSDLRTRAKGDLLLVEICRRLDADVLLVPREVRKYLDPRPFADRHISLDFVAPPAPVYPQLWGDFIANLSAVDLLLNCGPKAREMLLRGAPQPQRDG